MKASIIVPCYKVEKYLPRCLDSLVNQTLDDIEVIAINDGSPDKCIDILNDYREKYGEKIVVIDKQNEGVWRGRLDAIKLAKGEFIGFVDSDDFVEPTFCEDLYNAAVDAGADISVCGFNRVDVDTLQVLNIEMAEQRKAFNVQENPEMLLQLNGAPWNKFFKAELLKNLYDFVEPPKIFDDLIMQLVMYPHAKSVAFVAKPLVNYLIRNDSIMTTIDKTKVESTYERFLEVKRVYSGLSCSQKVMDFLDAAAFLHLGVSLMFRISYDESADLKQELKRNKAYLNKNFPTWGTSKVISFSSAVRYRGPFLKIYFARLVYKAGLMRLALSIYRKMILSGKDIKW